MDQNIYNFGDFLEECLKNKKDNDAKKLLNDLRIKLINNIGINNLNNTISKLFDETYSILTFLKCVADKKDWKHVLSEGLELIIYLLKYFFKNLTRYVLPIYQTAHEIALSNAGAHEKGRAIDILSNILNEDFQMSTEEVTNTYNVFIRFIRIQQNNASTTVRKHVFELLGIIAKKYSIVITNQKQLIDAFLSQLKRQSDKTIAERDKHLVSGCIDGLSNILSLFPLEIAATRLFLYSVVKKLITGSKTTFDFRGIISFISKHCSMLVEHMYDDSLQWWHKTLCDWVFENGKNYNAGYAVQEAFYTAVAELLKHRTSERDHSVFQYFYNYFLCTMKNNDEKIVRSAIRGFGIFSGPCKKHMTKQNLSEMFIIIISKMEHDYFVQENSNMEQLEYLPDYILCFSDIIFEIGDYTFDQIDSLQQMCVLMVKVFPRLSPIYHPAIFESLTLVMCQLYQHNLASLKSFLQTVVYKSVMLTCSHRTTFDVDLHFDSNNRSITYRDYIPLWQHILTLPKKSYGKCDCFSVDVKTSVLYYFHNELLTTLLLIVNKLNLNTTFENNMDIPIVDVQASCAAENSDDFIIFINVVDFYVKLMTLADKKMFRKWINIYIDQIVEKSNEKPYVSGFYKLITVALHICDEIQFFNQLGRENTKMCYQTILNYLEDVVVRVQEFKDDLQISCLELLLAIPTPFIQPLLPFMKDVFQTIFTVGRGNFKLAGIAVDTLDKWHKVLQTEQLVELLRNVLPLLDPYLRSKGYLGDPDIQDTLHQKRQLKHSSRSKRKVYIESECELYELQHKILMFVGQLQSDICQYIIETNNINHNVSDNDLYLKFTLPYSDVKPSIFLDKLLPRILELALTSADHKTRITACELLHAIVIFIIGTNRQMHGMKSKQLGSLFTKIITPILKLGCDSHDIVRQLFNPLAFQLVHWYSSPILYNSIETNILIDALMEGISHPTDTSVRDLSGKCISEFVLWTIKQCQTENIETSFDTIQLIVRKVCLYCVHPNSFKRFGAALAFNYIYKHLREEESIVDIFWLELLFSLLTSMSLGEARSITQIELALCHIERVLKEKHILFNRRSIRRQVPKVISEPLLKNIVRWIFEQTKSTDMVYRRKCIDLFCNLAPCVQDCSSPKQFIDNYISNENPNWYLEMYEDGISTMPTLVSANDCVTADAIMKWLQDIVRCLEAYNSLAENVIIEQLITNGSKLHISLDYFITVVSKNKLIDVLELLSSNYVVTNTDIKDFNNLKCLVVFATFDFLIAQQKWYGSLFDEYFWKFLCDCVFRPNIIGFNLNSKENLILLPQKLIKLLNELTKSLTDSNLNELCATFSTYIISNFDSNIIRTNHIPVAQRLLLKGLLLLQKCGLKDKLMGLPEYFSDTVQSVFKCLANDDQNTMIILSSAALEFAELSLKLAFNMDDSIHALSECLMSNTPLKQLEASSNITHGEYFFNTFKKPIMQHIEIHITEVIKHLCECWHNFSNNAPLLVVIQILKYFSQYKQGNNNYNLTECIMSSCEHVFTESEMSLNDRNLQIELMAHVLQIREKRTFIIGERYPYFKIWFVRQLKYTPMDMAPQHILQFKSNILSFIHCVVSVEYELDPYLQSSLRFSMDDILGVPFNQLDNTNIIVFFKKLLDYLVTSRSIFVLEYSMNIFTLIKYDDENVNINSALESYVDAIKPDQQCKSIQSVYTMCIDHNTHNPTCRYKMAKSFLPTLLYVCDKFAFEAFFVQNIKNILGHLRCKLENDVHDLVDRSIQLILIEILFSRINLSRFNDKSCPISNAAFGEKLLSGKELLIESTKIVKSIRKQFIQSEDLNFKELQRCFHCNTFNALVSIITNTKKEASDVNTYSYLLHEDKKSGECIWTNIIDCSKTIEIPQNFDVLPTRKKVFVSMREKGSLSLGNEVKYIESQHLFNSTLSEDICKFDFTNTFIRNISSKKDHIDKSRDNDRPHEIEIESVDINNHECMATVCGMVRHLVFNKISPLPTDTLAADQTLPRWMNVIKTLLVDPLTETNVKMFFLRVIHNEASIFKHYSHHFFEPIATFIVDKCASISYFVADLIEMLVGWSHVFAETKQIFSKLVYFLMENAHNDRHDMLKYNLEIIKTVVEAWKTVIVVPHQLLYDYIKNDTIKQQTGVHLLGVVLVNELVPWRNVFINDFISALLSILRKEKLKVNYKPVAEVLGIILNRLVSTGDPHLSSVKECIISELDKFEIDKLFNCIEQIQINHPEIIDRYIKKHYLKMYGTKDAILKLLCLKNILRRYEYIDVPNDFTEFLSSENRDIVLVALQIINKTITHLPLAKLKRTINAVCEHRMDQNTMIRFEVYEVLITVYKKCILLSSTDSVELLKLCRSVLLAAQLDTNLELQQKIQYFWCKEQYNDLKLTDRFIKSLTDLYVPENELYYLGYVIYFLLDPCKLMSEYSKLMFEYPLSECQFEEYKLRINWHAQHSSMVPMFASGHSVNYSGIPQVLGVRATASVKEFAPTPPDINMSIHATSSFWFNANKISAIKPTIQNEPNIFLNRVQHGRRFLKNTSKISLEFAKHKILKEQNNDEIRKNVIKCRDGIVVMYRNYRTGELPDIQIPNSAIIEPLQILARRDTVLARQIYVMLFDALITELDAPSAFINSVNEGIFSLYNQTTMYIPNVIGATLDVLLHCNSKEVGNKIKMDVDTLSTVCKNSGLLPIGCLLLEHQIHSDDELLPSNNEKRGCAVINERVNNWVQLANMYKELDEWDAVIGIFSSKHMECSTEDIVNAIHCDANGQFKNARDYYTNLINIETNFNRKDFYYECYFKCFANLSEWDTIPERINDVSSGALWNGDWNQEKMLPWYMLAQVYIALEGNKNQNAFFNELGVWMKDRNKAEYLKDKFSSELAILSLYQNDTTSSRHYIQNCFSQFLDNWSHLNPMFPQIRSNKLLNFQRIVDLNKYITHFESETDNLIAYWNKNSDLTCPSVAVTEIQTLYRQQLLSSFEHQLIKNDDDELDRHKLELREHNSLLEFNLIANSLHVNNYAIARKYCKRTAKRMNSNQMNNDGMRLSLSIVKVGVLVAELYTGNDKFDKLIESWRRFGILNIINRARQNQLLVELNSQFNLILKLNNIGLVDLQVESGHEIFKITQKIIRLIQDDSTLLLKRGTDINTLTQANINSLSDLQEFGITKLYEVIHLAELEMKHSSKMNISRALMAAYMEFVVFAQNQTDFTLYYEITVKFVLRSMSLGSKDARKLFPCLLQTPTLLESSSTIFKQECQSVPNWMFITWIPQLLVCMNSDCWHVVSDLLIRIATAYPQAMMYSYRLSRVNLDTETKIKTVVQKLDNLLINEHVEKFLFELSCVCIPELYFVYHLQKLLQHIDVRTYIQNKFQILKNDFLLKCQSSNNFISIGTSINAVEKLIHANLDINELKHAFSKIYMENVSLAKNINKRNAQFRNLENCSLWLANYRAFSWNSEIEVPGQYTGECKPLTKYHQKIFNFYSKISVFTSLRKPIKITILGNDSKEYPFLVKFGEDLRQDQRIQQLFSLANDIFSSDWQCSQRYLNLEQYQVIPMSTSLGIIRWVTDTKSLKELLYGIAENQQKLHENQTVYYNWIRAALPIESERIGDAELYANACLSHSKIGTVSTFNKLVNDIPANILCKLFWSLSADAECYTSMRQKFIVSYATMCLVHWLFGIGDRNLENCLVLLNSGRAVGIDFGHAFGTATQNLPIPELIPFRLTPHILSLMEPLRESGFVEQTMVHCIRALRKHKHVLISTMNVFIKEPSVDWLDYSKICADAFGNSSSFVNWYPDQRISLTRSKLNGVNPVVVTIEELQTNAMIENKEAYIAVARGDQDNIRSQLPTANLTEEQQVQCLLDQATDYNILGRMYHGLELWL